MTVRSSGFAFALALLAPGYSNAQMPPDFSGDWVVRDPAAGDSTAKSGDSPATPSHGGHGGGGHMGGRGGHSHGAPGTGSSSTSGANAASDAPVPRANAQALIIRQTDDVFDIEVNGQRMAYRFDGKHNYGPQYGGTVSLTWAAPEMVIETHPDAGGSIEEHYTLAPDGKALTLVVRTQQGDSTVREIRRVFVHPADAGQKTASGITLP